jgi:hypothetical protein
VFCTPQGDQENRFFEAINGRGLEQLANVFGHLVKEAAGAILAAYANFGDSIAIDGSLIDSVTSMEWASYRGGSKKTRAHVGFDINRGIPWKIFLTDCKEGEHPFVDRIINNGETADIDRR